MGDGFQLGSGNWWDSSSKNNRYDGSGSSVPSSTAAIGGGSSSSSIGNYGWPPSETVETNKTRCSVDDSSSSAAINNNNNNNNNNYAFQDSRQKLLLLRGSDSSGGTQLLPGLGLSSQPPPMDWNQPALLLSRNEKAGESSFRSMLQEEISEFKQSGRGFSLEQPPFSSNVSSGDSAVTYHQGFPPPSSFQIESSPSAASHVYGSPSTMLQGLLVVSDDDNQHQQSSCYENHRPMNHPYSGMNSGDISPSNWSKFPQFLTTSSSHPPPPEQPSHSQLHFSNNTAFWNASANNDVRPSSSFPSLQPHHRFHPPSLDEKTTKRNTTSEVRGITTVAKKSNSDQASSSKRQRNETATPLPAFKVRKEKMGDRITALQQLVSPFGKTDTASVLSEAIEYIKFLHEQVSVLSNPYMKNGAAMQHQQTPDKSSKDAEGRKPDLRSRGLCLVPVSSTFPVTHETTADFWTPTFGGTFR